MEGIKQPVERCARAVGDDPDAPVGFVRRPAIELQSARLAEHEIAKTDSLDAALDQGVEAGHIVAGCRTRLRRHLRQPVNARASRAPANRAAARAPR